MTPLKIIKTVIIFCNTGLYPAMLSLWIPNPPVPTVPNVSVRESNIGIPKIHNKTISMIVMTK